MTELLIHPYRYSSIWEVDECYARLSEYPNLDWIAPSLRIGDVAARVRAQHRLGTPDALQAATAIETQATGMLTNDSVFERLGEFETLVIEQLI